MAENLDDIKQNIIIEVKDSGLSETTADVSKLEASITSTTVAQKENTKATKDNAEAQKSFKAQLREAKAELQNAIQVYGETSQEAIKAAKGVAELNDQMGFAKDLADQFNPDQKMKSLGAASQIAATGVSAVVSGMALFGDQSKATEQVLLQVQSAMAFSDAISGLSDLGDQWTLLKTTMQQSAIVQKVVTAGQWLWNAAMNANPIGAIVLAITALIAAGALLIKFFADSASANKKAADAAIANNKANEALSKTLEKNSESTKINSDQKIALAKANGASSEEIRKLSKSLINQQVEQDKATATELRAIAVKEKYTLATLRSIGASQEAIDAQIKTAEDADAAFKKSNEKLKNSYAERSALVRSQEVEIAQEKTNAIKAAEAEAEKLAEKIRAKAEKLEEERKAKAKKAHEDELARLKKQAEELAKAKEDSRLNDLALQKEVDDAISAAQDENNKKLITAQELEIQIVKDKYFRVLELARQQGKDASAIEEQQANEINNIKRTAQEKQAADEKKIAEDRLIFEREIEDAKRGILEKGIDAIVSFSGKNKTIQRGAILAKSALGIADVSIDTVRAVQADMAVPLGAGLPKIPVDIATGALGVASIVKSTSTALNSIGAGGGASSSGGATVTVPSRNAPQVNFQSSPEGTISNNIRNNTNSNPIQAFVVEKEITTAQDLAKIKELNNKI